MRVLEREKCDPSQGAQQVCIDDTWYGGVMLRETHYVVSRDAKHTAVGRTNFGSCKIIDVQGGW